MKKYQLIFNSDSNSISYYINEKDLDINREESNKKGNGWKIFLIVFLVLIAFAVGIIFGRAMCIKYSRKLRANELEDNFSYAVKDSKNINQENDLMYINFKNNNNNI